MLVKCYEILTECSERAAECSEIPVECSIATECSEMDQNQQYQWLKDSGPTACMFFVSQILVQVLRNTTELSKISLNAPKHPAPCNLGLTFTRTSRWYGRWEQLSQKNWRTGGLSNITLTPSEWQHVKMKIPVKCSEIPAVCSEVLVERSTMAVNMLWNSGWDAVKCSEKSFWVLWNISWVLHNCGWAALKKKSDGDAVNYRQAPKVGWQAGDSRTWTEGP